MEKAATGAGTVPVSVAHGGASGAPCTRATAVTYIWQAFGSPNAGNYGFFAVAPNAAYASAVS